MSDGSLIFDTKIDGSGFEKGLDGLKGLASSGLKAVTGAVTAASTALIGLGAYASKVGSDFESSMSQVAATMGMTTEEINNGSEAFELLKETAKQAGATTQFSASESAEALNYLALAGYDATKACEALPTVLDLAAAGGMDLAYASDLITDSMSALGLATNQMNGFADQLAKTAQKSNTSVSQLGEAILTVGGTAKGLKGGTTELNTALGILADNGVKGAEGGTALRNVILSLSAPTDKAADMLKELGVSVLDNQGNMRALNDIMQDLDKSLTGLGEGEKNQVLSDIFNKNDLKSVQALLANSGARFSELSGYIKEADGACNDMAKTMNDNLKGRLKELGSAVEGFGIEIYEGIQGPLKEAAEGAIESIRNMSEAFKENGFEGLAKSLGDELNKWISKIADMIPQLIELGVSVVESFIQGIQDNLSNIVDSAEKIVMTLIRGIGSVLPKLISVGKDILLELVQSIIDNLDEILDVGLSIILELANAITEALPLLITSAVDIIISLVEYLLDNIDKVIDAAIAIIEALAKGLLDALPRLLEKAPVIIQKLVDAIVENVPKLLEAAVQIIVELAKGIVDNLPQMIECGEKILKSVIEGIINLRDVLIDDVLEMFSQLGVAIMGMDWQAVGESAGSDIVKGLLKMISPVAMAGSALYDVLNPKELGGGGRSFGDDFVDAEDDYTDAVKHAESYIEELNKGIAEAVEAKKKELKSSGTNVANTVAEGLENALDETGKKVENTITNAQQRYALLEQQAIIERSETYLELQAKLSEEERKQIEKDLEAKESIGIAGIQKAYNKYIIIEKAKITEKSKAVNSLEDKLSKQKKALQIASDTKDTTEAYRILKELELDLTVDLDEETRAQKLKDIRETSTKVKQEELELLAEKNEAKANLLKQSLDDEKALMEQYVSSYESTYSGMVTAYESAYSTIMGKQTTLESKFKAFGDLFDKFTQEDADGNKIEYMKLGDIQDDIDQLTLFGKALDALKEKGASKDFLEEITSMNMDDALDFSELLLMQTDEGLKDYLALWEEKQKLAGTLASCFYKDEFDTLKTEFTDKVNEELGLMSDEAEQVGKNTASKLALGLRSGVDEVKSAVSELVAQMQSVVFGEVASVGAELSTSSTVTQNIATKDNGVIGALGAIYGALTEGENTPILVELDGKKVGEGSVDGTIRELQRRGVALNVN